MIGIAAFQYFTLLILDGISLWWFMISFEKQRRSFILEYSPYFDLSPIEDKDIERQFGITLSWIVFTFIINLLVLRNIIVDTYTTIQTDEAGFLFTIFARVCILSCGLISYGFVYIWKFLPLIKAFKVIYNSKIFKL